MIKKSFEYGVLAALMAGAVSVPALADDMKAEEGAEPTKLEKALEDFDRTGETKRCINPSYMRSSNVVDDNHIIFKKNSRKSYLTTLKRKCHSLDFHESIAYEVRGSSICRGDTFRVLNGTGMGGAICSFGDFEMITRKEDDSAEASGE